MIKDTIKLYEKEYEKNWDKMTFEQIFNYNTYLTRLKENVKDEIFEIGYEVQIGVITAANKAFYIDFIAYNILMLKDIECAQEQCEAEMKKRSEEAKSNGKWFDSVDEMFEHLERGEEYEI